VAAVKSSGLGGKGMIVAGPSGQTQFIKKNTTNVVDNSNGGDSNFAGGNNGGGSDGLGLTSSSSQSSTSVVTSKLTKHNISNIRTGIFSSLKNQLKYDDMAAHSSSSDATAAQQWLLDFYQQLQYADNRFSNSTCTNINYHTYGRCDTNCHIASNCSSISSIRSNSDGNIECKETLSSVGDTTNTNHTSSVSGCSSNSRNAVNADDMAAELILTRLMTKHYNNLSNTNYTTTDINTDATTSDINTDNSISNSVTNNNVNTNTSTSGIYVNYASASGST